MIPCIICLIVLGVISISLYMSQQYLLGDYANLIQVNVNSKQILFETDEEFLSVALDMSFMRRSFHEFTFSDWDKLQQLSRLLSPAYLRLGGTDADRAIFNLSEGATHLEGFQQSNSYKSVLSQDSITITAKDWIKLNEFAQKSRLNLIIDLNVLLRKNSRWDSANAEALVEFSEQNGFPLSFQLGNEPNSFPHVFNKSLTGRQLAEDYLELRKVLRSMKTYRKSKVIGPEVTRPKNVEGSSLEFLAEFLSNGSVVDAVSWHQYYLNGHTATLEDFVNPETFDLLPPQINAISRVVRQHSATTPIWISETSSAYGGGAPELSDRFVACFLWLDKLGVSARLNMSVVIRQSLFKNHYSLIREDFTPTPDFWISVLYKNLVGKGVLDVKLAEDEMASLLRVYGHCLASNSSDIPPEASKQMASPLLSTMLQGVADCSGKPLGHGVANSLLKKKRINGSVVLYGMNLSDQTQLLLPSGMNVLYPVYSYIFKPDSNDLEAKTVLMNDRPLAYSQTVVEDMLKMAHKVKLPLAFPAKSVAFWVFKETAESACSR